MKLSLAFFVLADTKKVKPPVGCDPAWLGHYDIPNQDDCKRWKGFNTVPDENGVYLEHKGNFCPRKCKYGNLPTTVQAQCKCYRDWSSPVRKFDCHYRMKIRKLFKGFQNWNATDDFGKYLQNEYGQAKQEACVPPNQVGEWKAWGEWGGCEAAVEGQSRCGLSFHKRTRECTTEYCNGTDTSTKACVAYDNYGNFEKWPQQHPQCDNQREGYMPHGGLEYFQEGYHCVFPSFGKGWWQGQVEGKPVSMGVECEGNDVYDNDDHVIAGTGANCRLVCKADDPNDKNQYLPETSHWSQFQCLQPIPVPFIRPEKCFKDPWSGVKLQQCLPDWIEQGLDLKDKSGAGFAVPWYFDRQPWSCRTPGCGKQKKLSEVKNIINQCYKVDTDPKCPTEVPPLTDFEVEMGTVAADGIRWTCTDGGKPGSVCSKTCVNLHLERKGNPKMMCECGENAETGKTECTWQRKDENFTYVVYKNRASSCVKGCNASPAYGGGVLSGREFEVACNQSDLMRDGVPVDSGDIGDDAIIYMWNSITPVKEGNTCRVRCDDYALTDGRPREWQMPTYPEKNYFDIECRQVGDQMEWVAVKGDQIMECQQICYELGRSYQEEVDPIWTCTNKNFVDSTCTKSCPAGYKFDKTNRWEKTSAKCRKRSYGSSWSNTHFKKCIPDN